MTTITTRWGNEWSRGVAGDKADLMLATAQAAANNWAKYLQGDQDIVIDVGIGNVGGRTFSPMAVRCITTTAAGGKRPPSPRLVMASTSTATPRMAC